MTVRTDRRWIIALAVVVALLLTAGASGAGDFQVRLVSQTQSTVTLGWDQQASVDGFRFYRDGVLVSRSFDPARTTVRFSKGSSYRVESIVLAPAGSGVYPSSAVPGVFVATGGSDTNPCTSSAPCRSFARAHSVSVAGGTVTVVAGTYPAQTISSSKSPAVAFVPAGAVTVSRIDVLPPGSGVEVSDMTVGEVVVGGTWPEYQCTSTDAQCGPRARDVTLRNLDMASFTLTYVDGVKVIGGDVGPAVSCATGQSHPLIGHHHSSTTRWAPKNIVIDGVSFHDVTQGACGEHTECLLIWSGDTITVKNSTFRNCYSTGSMYVTELNLGDFASYCTGVVVEGNAFLGNQGSYDMVHFESDCGLTIRGNTFSGNARPYFLLGSQGVARPVVVIGNRGNTPVGAGCASGSPFVLSGNEWPAGTCGA